jgi:hypothetical protein
LESLSWKSYLAGIEKHRLILKASGRGQGDIAQRLKRHQLENDSCTSTGWSSFCRTAIARLEFVVIAPWIFCCWLKMYLWILLDSTWTLWSSKSVYADYYLENGKLQLLHYLLALHFVSIKCIICRHIDQYFIIDWLLKEYHKMPSLYRPTPTRWPSDHL